MTQNAVERARFNMIEQQIRPWEVLDPQVLDTFAHLPREAFVPDRYQRLAFTDVRIPLGHGETMMNPNVEGRLLQAIELHAKDNILEVGTGSGWLTACLAHLGGKVLSVDIHADFTAAAAARLQAHHINNVRLQTGDAAQDWGEGLFDVIVLGGAVPTVGSSWRERLKVGGRLFAVVGEPPIMEAMLITRTGQSTWYPQSLFDTELSYLVNAGRGVSFDF